MGYMRNVSKILIEKREGERPLERTVGSFDDDTKMDL
jgi:hypothetical protein